MTDDKNDDELLRAKVLREQENQRKKDLKEYEQTSRDIDAAKKDAKSKDVITAKEIKKRLSKLKKASQKAKTKRSIDKIIEDAETLQSDAELRIRSLAFNKFVFRKKAKLVDLGNSRKEIHELIINMEKASTVTRSDKAGLWLSSLFLDKRFLGKNIDEIMEIVNGAVIDGDKDDSGTLQLEEPKGILALPKLEKTNEIAIKDLERKEEERVDAPKLEKTLQNEIDSNTKKRIEQTKETEENNEKIYDWLLKKGEYEIADYILDLMTKPKEQKDKLSQISKNTETLKYLSGINQNINEELAKIRAGMVDEQDTSISIPEKLKEKQLVQQVSEISQGDKSETSGGFGELLNLLFLGKGKWFMMLLRKGGGLLKFAKAILMKGWPVIGALFKKSFMALWDGLFNSEFAKLFKTKIVSAFDELFSGRFLSSMTKHFNDFFNKSFEFATEGMKRVIEGMKNTISIIQKTITNVVDVVKKIPGVGKLGSMIPRDWKLPDVKKTVEKISTNATKAAAMVSEVAGAAKAEALAKTKAVADTIKSNKTVQKAVDVSKNVTTKTIDIAKGVNGKVVDAATATKKAVSGVIPKLSDSKIVSGEKKIAVKAMQAKAKREGAKRAAGVLLKLTKFAKPIPVLGWAITAGTALYAAQDGYRHADEILGKEKSELTAKHKLIASAASVVDDFTFGLINRKSTAKTIINWLENDKQKNDIARFVKAGIMNHDFIGNSEILDWDKVNALPSKDIKDLIDINDWSNYDLGELKYSEAMAKVREREIRKEQMKNGTYVEEVDEDEINWDALEVPTPTTLNEPKFDIENPEHVKAKAKMSEISGIVNELNKDYIKAIESGNQQKADNIKETINRKMELMDKQRSIISGVDVATITKDRRIAETEMAHEKTVKSTQQYDRTVYTNSGKETYNRYNINTINSSKPKTENAFGLFDGVHEGA